MIEEVLRYLRNFFPGMRWCVAEMKIENGTFDFDQLEHGDYFMLEGSKKNDGIHKYGEDVLEDEVFTGWVTELRIPKTLLDLIVEIESWQTKNAEQLESPYQSESFGGYSYTKASGTNGSYGWQNAFASRLRVWKKL